ncbi:MAG TPA: GNAT family N-acetyltransferase [Pseudolabrys sp.]|nr:GNAT family N-acetyltransferase [Pseudolabrys sp.]
MSVVALRPATSRNPPVAVPDLDVARVEIFDSIAAAEPAWRALEQGHCISTPYQRYDFLQLWQRHVGAPAGVEPFVVVAFNGAGVPLFLWPLGRRRVCGLKVAEFLGGKHANFNMGLWQRDVAPRIGAKELRAVLDELKGRIDLLALVNQPLTWSGSTNPLAALKHQRSANCGFSGALSADFEALLRARTNSATRKKMRKKERTLAGYGNVRLERASEPCEIRRVLDAFFKQKSTRMRRRGVSDVFAAPETRRFIEAAATETAAGQAPPVELYALKVDDIVVATMGGTVGGGRFCGMFNSILSDRFAAESPGEQLLAQLVRQCCERGLTAFDLGIGESHYKGLFCPDVEPLFDSFLPLSNAGRLMAIAYRLAATGKRVVKEHPALMSMVGSLRRLRARLSPEAQC